MRLISIFIFSIALFAIFQKGHAIGIVEPYLGFSLVGNGELKEESSNLQRDYKYNGLVYGLRGGFSTLSIMAGLEFSSSSFNMEINSKVNGTQTIEEVKRSKRDLGIFIGINDARLPKAWGTLYFDSSMEDKDGDEAGKKTEGNGFGIGVGFSPFLFLSINLEYRYFSYDQYKDATTERETALGVNEFDLYELILTFSAPINF